MNRSFVSPRTIIGCHGCTRATADAILSAGRFLSSENEHDWLGAGVYFWEYAPYRALEWAKLVALQRGEQPSVLAATVSLGNCVNLMDVVHREGLIATHQKLAIRFGSENLPRNTARGGNFLDRMVIDEYCDDLAEQGAPTDTVRGAFPEGEPIYSGSKILSLAHTQMAVRNPDCITKIRLIKF